MIIIKPYPFIQPYRFRFLLVVQSHLPRFKFIAKLDHLRPVYNGKIGIAPLYIREARADTPPIAKFDILEIDSPQACLSQIGFL